MWAIAQKARSVLLAHSPTPVILSEVDHSIIVIRAVEGPRRSQVPPKLSTPFNRDLTNSHNPSWRAGGPHLAPQPNSGAPYLDFEMWAIAQKRDPFCLRARLQPPRNVYTSALSSVEGPEQSTAEIAVAFCSNSTDPPSKIQQTHMSRPRHPKIVTPETHKQLKTNNLKAKK